MATVFLQLLLLLATRTAVVARNVSHAPAPAPSSPSAPSAAAVSFLRASCAAVDLPEACYDKTLLPYADSFHDIIARAARAAAAVAAARYHGFAGELARLKLRGTGAGRMTDMTLASCAERVASVDIDADEALGRLNMLVAGVRSRDEFDWEQYLVVQWLTTASWSMEECTDWFNDAGKAASSSPAGKEVIAGCTKLSAYIETAMGLVSVKHACHMCILAS